MTQERFWEIKALCDIYSDEPDGAFFALMEEEGVDIYEMAEYGECYDEFTKK